MKFQVESLFRWLPVLILSGCAWAGWRLYHESLEIELKKELLAGNREQLEKSLIAGETEKQISLAKRDESKAVLKQQTAAHPANHRRILLLFKLLETDKKRFGPSDPTKLKYSVGLGLGVKDALIGNPTYAGQYSATEKYRLETAYAPLLARWSSQNIDTRRLIDLLAEKSLSWVDARDVAQRSGLPQNQREALIENAVQPMETEISRFLGVENYREFKAYGEVVRGRSTVDLLQQRLSYAATPLSQPQYESLAIAVGRDESHFMLEGVFGDKAMSAARTILNLQQLNALVEFQSEKSAR